jgi:hypothetical protein
METRRDAMCSKPHSRPQPSQDALSHYLAGKPARAAPRKMQLWDIDGSMHCSILGTCLTERDLATALRRNGLKVAGEGNDYDVHGFCVREASHDTPLSRSLNKLLDRRYEGALRIVNATEDADALRQVWARFRSSGNIGAGYWALISHRHVPSDLKVAIFGEVHMLSHLNGRGAHELSLRLAEAEHRIIELERRLRRSAESNAEAMAARDAALEKLAAKDLGAQPVVKYAYRSWPIRGDIVRQSKTERALITARARARIAEEHLARVQEVKPKPARVATLLQTSPPLPPERAAAASASRIRILYVGGRPAVVPHLRKAADDRQAELLHHDGGVDDSMHRIEELVSACDVVMCPIDCVSHGACRIAKETCQRLRKRFMPITTASFSGFERALDQVTAA